VEDESSVVEDESSVVEDEESNADECCRLDKILTMGET